MRAYHPDCGWAAENYIHIYRSICIYIYLYIADYCLQLQMLAYHPDCGWAAERFAGPAQRPQRQGFAAAAAAVLPGEMPPRHAENDAMDDGSTPFQ